MKPPTDPPPPSKAGRRPGAHGSYRLGDRPANAPDPYDDGVERHRPGEHDELHNEDVAHEHSDINVRAVVTSAVIIVIVGLISHVIIWFMFGWMEQDAAAREVEQSPLARPATQMPAATWQSPVFSQGVAGPQLLTNEPIALEEHRAQEQKRLHGYGWINQAGGVAHMPISEAKKRILERGLPVREGDPVAPGIGSRRPAYGESSSGRFVTLPPEEAQVPSHIPGPDHAPQGNAPEAKPHGQGGH